MYHRAVLDRSCAEGLLIPRHEVVGLTFPEDAVGWVDLVPTAPIGNAVETASAGVPARATRVLIHTDLSDSEFKTTATGRKVIVWRSYISSEM